MVPPVLATIVEGDGEVDALPVLLRHWFPSIVQLKPIRVARDRFVRHADEQRRYAQLARRLGADRLLVLLDGHEDCPVELVRRLTPPIAVDFGGPVGVVIAVREYEAWFLQCLPEFHEFMSHGYAERVRGAKERIVQARGRYSPTADQAALTAKLARVWPGGVDPSFQPPRSLSKLHREVCRLLGE